MFKKFLEVVLISIYPKRCVFCDEVLDFNDDEGVCKYCYMDIDFIINDNEFSLSVFEYNDKTRYSILRLKYNNKKHYAKVFAEMMYYKLKNIDISKYDYIINVPMYRKKKKKRGYDQAEVIAIELSKICGIPFEKGNLIRHKNTLPQSKVSFEQRRTNVDGVFYVKNANVFKGKNIILIDDIYTSGSTILQCAKELKKCDAEDICCFTLSKVVSKSFEND